MPDETPAWDASMMDGGFVEAMTDGETIFARAELGAPPDRVFPALVTPQVEQWRDATPMCRMVGWSAELRVGGRWTMVARTDGEDRPAGGEFLEIEPPRRIVQTRAYGWDHPALGRRRTTVAWLLQPVDGGTRVTVCHGGFGGLREAAAEHAEGWGRVLGRLQLHVGSASAG